jgi:hypothetical protein
MDFSLLSRLFTYYLTFLSGMTSILFPIGMLSVAFDSYPRHQSTMMLAIGALVLFWPLQVMVTIWMIKTSWNVSKGLPIT